LSEDGIRDALARSSQEDMEELFSNTGSVEELQGRVDRELGDEQDGEGEDEHVNTGEQDQQGT
jgi:hypothetical protein